MSLGLRRALSALALGLALAGPLAADVAPPLGPLSLTQAAALLYTADYQIYVATVGHSSKPDAKPYPALKKDLIEMAAQERLLGAPEHHDAGKAFQEAGQDFMDRCHDKRVAAGRKSDLVGQVDRQLAQANGLQGIRPAIQSALLRIHQSCSASLGADFWHEKKDLLERMNALLDDMQEHCAHLDKAK